MELSHANVIVCCERERRAADEVNLLFIRSRRHRLPSGLFNSEEMECCVCVMIYSFLRDSRAAFHPLSAAHFSLLVFCFALCRIVDDICKKDFFLLCGSRTRAINHLGSLEARQRKKFSLRSGKSASFSFE